MRNNDQKRLERQSRAMATKAQGDWSKKNPIKNGCMTLFALGFLGLLGVLVFMGINGAFD